MTKERPVHCKLVEVKDLDALGYDGILLVSWPGAQEPQKLYSPIQGALKIDAALQKDLAVIPLPSLPAGRLVFSPTGPIDPDYEDVRVLGEAAGKAMKRAVKAGVKKPLLVLQKHPRFDNGELVTLLGALEATYVPIQIRESDTKNFCARTETLGVYSQDPKTAQEVVKLAQSLESGRYVARDIGGADPERMAPPRVLEYVRDVFQGTCIKVTAIEDHTIIAKEYPLFEAVDRCARKVDRHRGCIIYLEYMPEGATAKDITDTLMLVGKGVTYDTGGADIKAGGVMAGMSRDKCGAAAVAGFMKICAELKPKNLKVIGAMSMVRNSVGSECYVSDELITSRSGLKVRIGNTDAEGRMVMADVLCKLKEAALQEVNPHLFTIATLTGHACLAAGMGYSIVLDNGPARNVGNALTLQARGEAIGDPFEVSTMRREDLEFHRGKTEGDDILQANNAPSTKTGRGHQAPAAFLLMTSGLSDHGSGSKNPLKYSHLDIAASAGDLPGPATGCPVLALANTFILT